MAIVGIDLGTTNSLVAAHIDGESKLIPNAFGELLTPSVVSIMDNGDVVVGKLARERLVTAPDCSAARFKRLMGTGERIYLNGREFSPEELSSLVIRQLVADAERYLGECVTEAVVSVPAYFDVSQRAATKRAGALAGVKVERLVNEPSAAALAYRTEGEDTSFVVFDFGGGTLDVSVVDCFDNVVSISAVSGDNQLGGSDFDRVIAEEAARHAGVAFDAIDSAKREVLMREAETAKRLLTDEGSARVQAPVLDASEPLQLTNETLFELSRSLFARVDKPLKQAIYDSDLPAGEIDRVILVGGSCHMPVVRQYLASVLAVPVSSPDNCDYAVAQGLGTYVGIKQRAEGVRDLVLTDICPYSLSTDVKNDNPPFYPLSSFIIRRNTILPTSNTRGYITSQPGQKEVEVGVFQGENIYAKDNKRLAELRMKIPVNRKKNTPFTVTFAYDINAILCVEIRLTDADIVRRFVYNGSGWDEGDKGLAALDDLQLALDLDGPRLEARYTMERALSVAAMAREDMQGHIMMLLQQYSRIAQSNNLLNIRRRTEEFNQILDDIERMRDAGGIFRTIGPGGLNVCDGPDWTDPEAWDYEDEDNEDIDGGEGME